MGGSDNMFMLTIVLNYNPYANYRVISMCIWGSDCFTDYGGLQLSQADSIWWLAIWIWGWDEKVTVLWTTFSNYFACMKMVALHYDFTDICYQGSN